MSVRNDSGKALKDVMIDFRPPPGRHPFSVAAEWLLPRPLAKLNALAAGEERAVTLPTMLDGRLPFEDGQIRVNLRATGGFEAAFDDNLWLLPAPTASAAPRIDGDLGQWEGRSAAWMAYDWGWALFGRHEIHFHEGGEHFSYPPYRLDARAAFWASWDAENLCPAIRLDDDQPLLDADAGESVRLVIATGAKRHEVDLKPRADGSVSTIPSGLPLRSRSSVVERQARNGAAARLEAVRAIQVEAAVPRRRGGGGGGGRAPGVRGAAVACWGRPPAPGRGAGLRPLVDRHRQGRERDGGRHAPLGRRRHRNRARAPRGREALTRTGSGEREGGLG